MSRNYLQPLNNNIKPRINEEYQKEHLEGTPTKQGSASEEGEPRNGLEDVSNSNAAAKENHEEADRHQQQQAAEAEERLKDWSPESRCYFCVDGKLDSEHTAHGVLVRKRVHLKKNVKEKIWVRKSCLHKL